MTLAEQAERMAERLGDSAYEIYAEHGARVDAASDLMDEAAALLRQCAEALRKEGV